MNAPARYHVTVQHREPRAMPPIHVFVDANSPLEAERLAWDAMLQRAVANGFIFARTDWHLVGVTAVAS